MATDDRTGRALEQLFAAGRDEPASGEALVARIMADAAELPVPAAGRGGLGAMLMSLLGGWPAMAGMATAAAAGIWIGFSSPDLVFGGTGDSTASGGYALGDFMPDLTELASGE